MCADNKKNTNIAKQTGFHLYLKKFGISNFEMSERDFVEDVIDYFDDFTI